MNKLLRLVLCMAVPLAIGALSGIATAAGVRDWYLTLHKPVFNPPNYLFAPVWTILYLLMGVSLYLVLQSTDAFLKKRAVILFGVQLLLNFCWSFLFFKFHLIQFALADIVCLWLVIIGMIPSFYGINKWAGLLQIPYLLWVSFATVLNAAIYILN
jgi:translocator protein